jgi:hypothetical protein
MNVIRQTRHQVETLTWLRAILLICAEGRKALAEVSEALRDGEVRTRCATYVAESCLRNATMIDIADRLIAAGLGKEVWKAGVFASTKGELISPPEEQDPAHELLEAIHACNDAGELNALWDHVFDALYEQEEPCECGDFSEMQAAAESLIEAGHAERVKEAGKFAASKLDILDLGGDVDWTPDSDDGAHNELFVLVDENYDEIALVGFSMYVEERLAA